LTWPNKYLNHEENELDNMLYKFQFVTRTILANVFIRLILLVCGTASFLDHDGAAHMFRGKSFASHEEAISFLKKVADNVKVYISPNWNSPDMPNQSHLDPMELQGLMAFVSERMKLSLESLIRVREKIIQAEGNINPDITQNRLWVTPEEVGGYVAQIFTDVFGDYISMFYCATESFVTEAEFLCHFAGPFTAIGDMFFGNMSLDMGLDFIQDEY